MYCPSCGICCDDNRNIFCYHCGARLPVLSNDIPSRGNLDAQNLDQYLTVVATSAPQGVMPPSTPAGVVQTPAVPEEVKPNGAKPAVAVLTADDPCGPPAEQIAPPVPTLQPEPVLAAEVAADPSSPTPTSDAGNPRTVPVVTPDEIARASLLASAQSAAESSSFRPPSIDTSPATAKEDTRPWRNRTRTKLLAALAAVMVLCMALTGAYMKVTVDQRDGIIIQLDQNLVSTTSERDQVRSDLGLMTTERDGLKTDVERVTGQRNQAQADLGKMTSERDDLTNQVKALEKTTADLQGTVAQSNQAADAAKAESTRQQSRANSAEYRSGALAEVIALDDKIYLEIGNFLTYTSEVYAALDAKDYTRANQAYAAAKQSSDRIGQLSAQRKAAADKVL